MTFSDSEIDQFAKLKGGQKHMWLRHHKEAILAFYDAFGEADTRKTFCITETTLQSLIGSKNSTRRFSQLSKADRAIARAEITEAGLIELRREVKELKQLFEHFQQSVGEQLLNRFFMTLLQSGIKVDKRLDEPEPIDPLRIDNIDFTKFKSEINKKR
jgi:hypothetical protein